MEGLYILVYLALLVIFWRWWTVPIMACFFMYNELGELSGPVILGLHVIGLIAERARRKRKKAQADEAEGIRRERENAQTGERAPAGDNNTTSRVSSRPQPEIAPRRLEIVVGASSAEREESPPQPEIDRLKLDSIVDINSAKVSELILLSGIGPAEAALIQKRIQAGQGFGSLDELAEYLRLKPHHISHLRDKVRFAPLPPGATPPGDGPETAPPRKSRSARIID
ncbi:MAG: helix-hairpin-helix domain-containing protein [Candidatus Accumulibacter sp.]|jgi:DNA uptake protein ComE-like DNA-binding protein|nr:helix-hairpin-helix domain-containing protein [Accumulibacter sp.]